jgi:hypothetical protein
VPLISVLVEARGLEPLTPCLQSTFVSASPYLGVGRHSEFIGHFRGSIKSCSPHGSPLLERVK